MTLAESIEGAREALKVVAEAIEERHVSEENSLDNMNISGRSHAEMSALEEVIYQRHLSSIETIKAALPDQPKSEDEIIEIAVNAYENASDDGSSREEIIIRALKAANVLYVKEG